MKTFETLSIDELIDYCINFRKSTQLYNELQVIKGLFDKKIELVGDEDEKEFYQTIIEDIFLEIEMKSEYVDYDVVKHIMLDEYINNFNIIDGKIKQELVVENELLNELKCINLSHQKRPGQYIMSAKDEIYLDINYDKKLLEGLKMLIFCEPIYFNIPKFPIKIPNTNDYNFELITIGQFQKLSKVQCREIDFQINCKVDLISCLFLGKKRNLFSRSTRKGRIKLPKDVTCFKPVDTLSTFSDAMSYYKINKEKHFSKSKHLKQDQDQDKLHNVASNIKAYLYHKVYNKHSEVVWFKLDIPNGLNNFDYSSVYKNKIVNSRKITWFKLMDYERINHHSAVTYFRIETDGSITKEEVAYFDMSEKYSCENNKLKLVNDETEGEPDTLHYIIADKIIDVRDDNLPMLIGYSELEYSQCLKY